MRYCGKLDVSSFEEDVGIRRTLAGLCFSEIDRNCCRADGRSFVGGTSDFYVCFIQSAALLYRRIFKGLLLY